MGFFDDLIDLPGKVLETGFEVVTRIPEAGIKAAEGAVKGVVKGVEKTLDTIENIGD